MGNPLVSVIIPTHNGDKYLGEAIGSVMSQNYSPIEVIAVDDGSTDSSVTVVKRFGSCVHYCYQPNAGTGSARNAGVFLSRGDYLAFLDQDDVWDPKKLTFQIEALSKDKTLDAVFGYVEQFSSREIFEKKEWSIPSFLKRRPGISPSGILLKRRAFERVGPFNTCFKIGEWADWYLRAIDCGLRMKVIDVLVAKRRIHKNNKGRLFRNCQNEYVRVLKASLNRRKQLVLT